MNTIFLVILQYDISFNDADEGDCYAGEGQRVLKAFSNKNIADELAQKMNPIISLAEQETTIYPIQKNNRKLLNELGLIHHNIDNGYNFKLVVEEIEVTV